MSIIGKLIRTAVDVVTLPVSIAADVLTMGGAVTDRDEPYTIQHTKAVLEDLIDVIDEAEKL